jgi:hypothetical protein
MTDDPLAREFFDTLYEGVVDLMQTHKQLSGQDPWPAEVLPIFDAVVAATVGYLAHRVEQRTPELGQAFRNTLRDAVLT